MPPGNGIAALALLDLGHLFAEQRYLAAANRTIDWARGMMEQQPAGHCSMLAALEASREPAEQIIVRGPRDALPPWLETARRGYLPRRKVYGLPYGAEVVPPYLPQLVSAESAAKVVAYRCEGFSCSLPLESIEELAEVLEQAG
jgi:hypothetical protein